MKILLIDNFDSFTYNLVHALESLDAEVTVIRNNEPFEEAWQRCDAVVLSPGPGLPEEAGSLLEVVEMTLGQKPMLGVCLGHQALLEYHGCKLRNMETVRHGESDKAMLPEVDTVLFAGFKNEVEVGLYHSWAVRADEVPPDFKVTATLNGYAMAVEHNTLPVFGVQFHPESVLTPKGLTVLRNWLGVASS
jgi:anthranilate synthase component 2